jgi:hypothetical protein
MENKNIGVIVGRFEVPYLTKAHRYLIDTVCGIHKKVVILLGIPENFGLSIRYPLTFEIRKQMLYKYYPNILVLPLKDNSDDVVWSNNLDNMLKEVIGDNHSFELYSGSNGFIPYYHGSIITHIIDDAESDSGSDIRNSVGLTIEDNVSFRKGVIWAVENYCKSTNVKVESIFGKLKAVYFEKNLAIIETDTSVIPVYYIEQGYSYDTLCSCVGSNVLVIGIVNKISGPDQILSISDACISESSVE